MKRIDVVAAVIFNSENKILIARRALHKKLAGKWEFPGGKVEKDESPQEALQRELFEEFNIQTKTGNFICSNTHEYNHISIKLLAYQSILVSGDFTLSDHDRIEWVPINELLHYDLAEADIPIVKHLISSQ